MSADFEDEDEIGESLHDAPSLPLPDEETGDAGPCPVTPLGYDGTRCSYQSVTGQVITLTWQEHSRKTILGLFGGEDGWLMQMFPIHRKKEIIGWSSDTAYQWLLRACKRANVFDPSRDMRGAGAWRYESMPGEHSDDDPAIVLHCGDKIWVGDYDVKKRLKWAEPGRCGQHVYPAVRREMHPADRQAQIAEVEALRSLIATWQWKRPETDPILFLGFIAIGYVIGAVDWRASIWVTGEPGTGKSTLLELAGKLLETLILGPLAGATAASVRQLLARLVAPGRARRGRGRRRQRQGDRAGAARGLCVQARRRSGGARRPGPQGHDVQLRYGLPLQLGAASPAAPRLSAAHHRARARPPQGRAASAPTR
jgi:hypothetical protein